MDTKTGIVLARRSAARYWLTADLSDGAAAKRYRGSPPDDCVIDKHLVDSLRQGHFAFANGNIELLINDPRHARKHEGIGCLVNKTGLASKTLFVLDNRTFVLSPEVAFVQMGAVLDLAQMAELGCRLCANYYTDPVSQQILERSSPATTPEQLAKCVERMKGTRGIAAAQRALKWVVARAESPREITAMLMLCLPYRYGGYGCPTPVMNHPVLPGRSSSIVGKDVYRADLCWPTANAIVEYDGKEYHQNADRDKRRINDLEALGWKVFSLVSDDLNSRVVFESFVLKVAKQIGHQIKKPSSWREKNVQLRKDLRLPPC